MTMKRILITGAGGPPASNFVQSLRMAAEDVYLVGCDSNKYHLELAAELDSKYLVPPADDPSYIDQINRLIEIEEINFVHPQPDVEVLAIGNNRERLKARTWLPSNRTIELCQDKMSLNVHLRDGGVPVPRAFHLKSEAALASALDSLILEQDRAWIRAKRGAGSRASLPIQEAEQGNQWVRFWMLTRELSFEDFMLSEFLPGREYAFQSIWMHGEIITSQARERIEYLFGNLTPSGQTSTPSVARSVHRQDLNEIASRAVRTVDEKASGVFCVDLKENLEGVPCVTEVNAGRFFTTSNFFAAAGSNMPYYYVKLAFDDALPDLPKYNAVAKGLYWVRNVDMGFKLIRGEEWTSKEL
jgi:carbamoyl-phosphate synthase large subunit